MIKKGGGSNRKFTFNKGKKGGTTNFSNESKEQDKPKNKPTEKREGAFVKRTGDSKNTSERRDPSERKFSDKKSSDRKPSDRNPAVKREGSYSKSGLRPKKKPENGKPVDRKLTDRKFPDKKPSDKSPRGFKDKPKTHGKREGKSKMEVKSVFSKPRTYKKAESTPSDKKVQYIEGNDLNYRTKLDKKGFSNANETKVSTVQVLDNTEIRLNKFIATAGVCSRREADEMITQGLITVNGKEVKDLGTKVKPTDRVKYDGKLLTAEEKVYVLMNKPKGFITTTSDPEDRQTVLDILQDSLPYRVFPVGRLDRNTTGVLLLTNDGDFMEQVTHPKYNITKIYRVGLDRKAEMSELQQLLDGVVLEDGLAKADNVAYLDDTKTYVGIEIHSGKNRIIRRMFEHLNIDVKSLDRTAFGPFTKTNLRPGQFRHLNDKEAALVDRLKNQKPKKKS